MSDNTTDDTSEWLTSKDTIEATVSVDGEELPIEVKDITREELLELEAMSEDGPDAEDEAIRDSIEEYLVAPDVNPDKMPMRKRSVLFFAMHQAWSGAEEIQAAMDEMEMPGNPR